MRAKLVGFASGNKIQPIESSVDQANSLAQTIIAAGVEAFVGTLWEVGDAAAKQFAAKLYENLTAHESLRDSVTTARHHLASKKPKRLGQLPALWRRPVQVALTGSMRHVTRFRSVYEKAAGFPQSWINPSN